MKNSSKKIKQINVAQAAGVGRSTVSMILSGKEDKFSWDVIKRVKKADIELGYSQTRKRKPLSKKKNNATDLIYCIKRKDLDSAHLPEFYTKIAFLLEKAFSKLGKSLILKNIDDAKELRNYIDTRPDTIGGVILHGHFSRDEISLIEAKSLTLSIFIKTDKNSDLPLIELDNENATFNILSYLSSLGHKKVAYLGAVPRVNVSEQRLNGFLLAVRKLGLEEALPFEEINKDMKSFLQAEQYAELFLDLYEKAETKPTAVVCATSAMASFLIEKAKKRNIRVPEDLNVTGFDNLTVSIESPMKLTSISTPVEKICDMAANLILAAEKGVEIKGMTLRIPCDKITPGDSTKRVAQK